MEAIRSLQDIKDTIDYGRCEHKECHRIASYICPDFTNKLLCQRCMDKDYFDVECIEYINPNDLSVIVVQSANMLKRISKYCNQLENSPKTTSILEELKIYQDKVTSFEDTLLKAIKSGSQSYRVFSDKFYKEVIQLRKELFSCKMYQSFKDLHTKHFVLEELDEKECSDLDKNIQSDIKVILNQMQQFVGKSKIPVQKHDITLYDIKRQMESIEEDAGYITAKIIDVAKQIIQIDQENCIVISSNKQTCFSMENSAIQEIKSIVKYSEGQKVSLSVMLKNLETLVCILKQDFNSISASSQGLNEETKGVDLISMSSKESSISYFNSEFEKSNKTTDEVVVCKDKKGKSKAKAKLKNDKIKIKEDKENQNRKFQTMIDELLGNDQEQAIQEIEEPLINFSTEENNQEVEDQLGRVQKLEFYHNETIKEVLQDTY